MTENLKRCPFCGRTANIAKGQIEFWAYCPHCGAQTELYETEQEVAKAWNTRQVEGELLKKYENALFEICFCCAAVDCSLEQQSEALKAIDKICAEFYSIPEEELRGKNEDENSKGIFEMTKDEKLALLKLSLDEKIKRTFNMRQEFYDLAKKIADWHTVTFKDADKAGQLLKLDEEFDEWRAETADPEKRITELADCFIVASALWFRFEAAIGMFTCKAIVKHCADADGELYDAIQKKMTINFNRSWKKQANGSYHH